MSVSTRACLILKTCVLAHLSRISYMSNSWQHFLGPGPGLQTPETRLWDDPPQGVCLRSALLTKGILGAGWSVSGLRALCYRPFPQGYLRTLRQTGPGPNFAVNFESFSTCSRHVNYALGKSQDFMHVSLTCGACGSVHRRQDHSESPNRRRFASLDVKNIWAFGIAGQRRKLFAGALWAELLLCLCNIPSVLWLLRK